MIFMGRDSRLASFGLLLFASAGIDHGDGLADRQRLAKDGLLVFSGIGRRGSPLQIVTSALVADGTQAGEAEARHRNGAGPQTVMQIVAALYADVDPRLHGAAALSVRAHLDHLIERELARDAGGQFLVAPG